MDTTTTRSAPSFGMVMGSSTRPMSTDFTFGSSLEKMTDEQNKSKSTSTQQVRQNKREHSPKREKGMASERRQNFRRLPLKVNTRDNASHSTYMPRRTMSDRTWGPYDRSYRQDRFDRDMRYDDMHDMHDMHDTYLNERMRCPLEYYYLTDLMSRQMLERRYNDLLERRSNDFMCCCQPKNTHYNCGCRN